MQDPIFPYSSISLLDRIEKESVQKNLPIVFLVNSIDIVNEYKSFYETFN